jgi:trigger factor
MQANLLDKQAVSATLEVIISADEVGKTYDKVLQGLSKQVRIPGFRPGKIPRNVLIKQIGEDALGQEVREALVEDYYGKAVQELKLTPIHAHLHKTGEPAQGQEYRFEVHVDLYPEFELPDVKEIIIDTPKKTLNDEMVQEAIENLQREHAILVPVERGVESTDHVTLAIGDEGSHLPVDLERAGNSIVQQLLGKNMGDEIELSLGTEDHSDHDHDDQNHDNHDHSDHEGHDHDEEAPNEAPAPENAEAAPKPEPLKLKAVIQDIKAKEKPAIDDDFAKTLGFDTWQAAEEQLRKSLKADLDRESFSNQQNEFIEKYVEEAKLELPNYLVNRRKSMLLEELQEDLKKNNLTLEAYFKQLDEKNERETFDKNLQETAQARVKRDLVLEQLLEKRGTMMTNTEFETALSYMAYREGKNLRKFKSEMGDTWLENYRFLLTRDKAIREVVREVLGEEAVNEVQEIAEEIAEAQDAE